MGFEEFEDLAARVVTVEPVESETPYGVLAYGDPVEMRARVRYGPVSILSAEGEEIVSRVRVYVGSPVGSHDRITIPDAAPNATPPILRVERVDDENGPHHWVVYC